eukprot:GILK01005556.1.p1 GENE.GILK01005556.1~~GILK01005556.1.p1  ORF type:complete len:586 (+),score=131.88 GILK01005556.1:57-1814(+)
MGKNQHSKDKMYITSTEYKHEWGGKKEQKGIPFKKLPFHCCALSFTPFEDPVATSDGSVFEVVHIMPYIKKFKKHPVTGEPLSVRDLIALHFHKNADGRYHCPVTYKVFTEHTHIVAIKTSGNVYSYEAVDELNKKAKNWTDLLTGEPFTAQDIMTIQNPHDVTVRTIDQFDHVVANKVANPQTSIEEDPRSFIRTNAATERIFQSLEAKNIISKTGASAAALNQATVATPVTGVKRSAEEILEEAKKKLKTGATATEKQQATVSKTAATVAAAAAAKPKAHERYTTGRASASLTSTAVSLHTRNELRELTVEEQRATVYAKVRKAKKKGYVRITTTHGMINIELHCDLVPMTCDNFLGLCENNYYENTIFHRSIRNFMIQGGDPTGTGRGGESIWKKPFRDEFHPKLSHSGRGIVAMANSGPGTNRSQFYITYKSCRHLDNKHSVFGTVVGGLETLNAMEAVETNMQDKPKQEIKITEILVFSNPFKEVESNIESEKPADFVSNEEDAAAALEHRQWFSNPTPAGHTGSGSGSGSGSGTGSVGKYLQEALAKQQQTRPPSTTSSSQQQQQQQAGGGGGGGKDLP